MYILLVVAVGHESTRTTHMTPFTPFFPAWLMYWIHISLPGGCKEKKIKSLASILRLTMMKTFMFMFSLLSDAQFSCWEDFFEVLTLDRWTVVFYGRMMLLLMLQQQHHHHHLRASGKKKGETSVRKRSSHFLSWTLFSFTGTSSFCLLFAPCSLRIQSNEFQDIRREEMFTSEKRVHLIFFK